MTSDYRRGLERLGVIQNDQQTVDLRTNPAFAWKVQCAFLRSLRGPDCYIGGQGNAVGNWKRWLDLAEKLWLRPDEPDIALYAAVEQLGAEQP